MSDGVGGAVLDAISAGDWMRLPATHPTADAVTTATSAMPSAVLRRVPTPVVPPSRRARKGTPSSRCRFVSALPVVPSAPGSVSIGPVRRARGTTAEQVLRRLSRYARSPPSPSIPQRLLGLVRARRGHCRRRVAIQILADLVGARVELQRLIAGRRQRLGVEGHLLGQHPRLLLLAPRSGLDSNRAHPARVVLELVAVGRVEGVPLVGYENVVEAIDRDAAALT